MANPPIDFGKRRPAVTPQPSPPVKRSGHVALLVMGTMAVGGGAYAVMQRQNCPPNNPTIAAPASPEAATACTSRSWGSSHGGSSGWWSHSSFYSGSSSSSSSSTSSGTSETTRGGFGSFARSISAHFSGG
jgi:hypothetical protein